MQHSLSQIVTFYYVVDLMSFSKAAEKLHISKAYVSKQVAALEDSLGVKLIERSTRHLQPTFAGSQLYEHGRKIILEFQGAEASIAALQDKPKGILRVTAPTAFAAHALAPQLPCFLQQYPEVSLDLHLTGMELDLLKERIDVAIRLTHTPPEDRIAKRIGVYQLQCCATPAYLEQHEPLKHPKQLVDHACLVYSTQMQADQWPFICNGKQLDVHVQPALSCNNHEVLLNAVLSDQGIARLPSYVIRDAVQQGRLKAPLTEFLPEKIPIYAIYAPGINTPLSVKVFIEFLQGLEGIL